MEWFGSVTSIEELKGEYLGFLKKWKNDKDVMGEIDAQYTEILERLGVIVNQEIDEANKSLPDEFKKKHYDIKNDRFKDVLNKVIDFNMRIEIIGQWIWCFESFDYRDELKELGFWYTASKKAWVYNGQKKKFVRTHNKLEDVKKKWGVEYVKEREEA